jgi:hypothetical protein
LNILNSCGWAYGHIHTVTTTEVSPDLGKFAEIIYDAAATSSSQVSTCKKIVAVQIGVEAKKSRREYHMGLSKYSTFE